MSSPYAPTQDAPVAGFAGAPSIDLLETIPPPAVLDQMANADAINARLCAEGRQISFALSDDGCSLQIELRDTDGHLLRILSAAEAVELAAGAGL
ncbi:MAG TPA: hypothetical protein VN618_12885 [Solirubrobacteraceae bacterium]|nr:hypothetical protein [Solirubrobacteraceae bacterium]